MTQAIVDEKRVDKPLQCEHDLLGSVHSGVLEDSNTKGAVSSSGRRIVIGVILLLVLASGFVAGILWGGISQKREVRLQLPPVVRNENERDLDRLVVTVSPVFTREIERTIQAVGTLNGFEELTISSKLEGTVVRIFHDLSSLVKPGDVLLELDTRDALLAVRQSEMSLQAELSKWGFQTVPEQEVDVSKLPTVVTAKLRWELAQSRLARMLPLQSSNSITADDVEQAKSEAKVAESEYQNQLLLASSSAATARLKAAELEIAKKRLADCQIMVPFPSNVLREEDGFYTVSERLVSEGSLLRPGTEVFRIVLGKSLKLKLSVPQIYADLVRVGQSVAISVDSYESRFRGAIQRISPAIDRSNRTLAIEVDVPNPDGRLKAGSFAKASISIGKSSDSICVPQESISSFAGIQKIFLIQDDVAKEVKVTLGERSSDWVEITSPKIEKGAQVVTSGQRMLSNDMPVRTRPTYSSKVSSDIGSQQLGRGD